jgi:Na+/proline symporter
VLVLVAVVATLISINSNATMYEMVEAGYSVTLVTAFAPMAFGIYWSRASTQGAWLSLVLAVAAWLGTKYFWLPDEPTGFWDAVPSQLYGLAGSIVGMMIGSLLPQVIRQAHPDDTNSGTEPRRASLGH